MLVFDTFTNTNPLEPSTENDATGSPHLCKSSGNDFAGNTLVFEGTYKNLKNGRCGVAPQGLTLVYSHILAKPAREQAEA